jgi:hypothetical protein
MMTPGNAPQVSVQEATEAIVEKQEMRTCRECGHVHKTDFYCLHVIGPGNSCGCVVGVHEKFEALRNSLEDIFHLMPAWREAIAELEDFCSEPVRLKNMVAALDQIDLLYPRARKALQKAEAYHVEPD